MATLTIAGRDLEAAIFDTDGVITDTASVHFTAWKDVFDAALREHGGAQAHEFTHEDYLRHVDGVGRYDGVRRFLASRGIELAEGEAEDPPDSTTVCGIGNRKNEQFLRRLRADPAPAYDGTIALVQRLREAGVPTAVISASRNAAEVLASAGVADLFDARVDGAQAARLGLAGKPDPAVFLEAASRLGVAPDRTMVVEDAQSGVRAAHDGGFGLVVGVDRGRQRDRLLAEGADMVVEDLAELLTQVTPVSPHTRISDLPDIFTSWEEFEQTLRGHRPAVFLDFDGTLSPIVEDPAAAALPDDTRQALKALADVCPVVIVSGRDADDVRDRVAIDDVVVAGSHGFDVVWPDGRRTERGQDYLDELRGAAARLDVDLTGIPGVEVETKRFAVAVHHRRTPSDHLAAVEVIVSHVADAYPRLRRSAGKQVLELRPGLDWDKGTTLRWLLVELDLDHDDVAPLYLGDDLTDEDAFAALRDHGRGIGVVVRGEDDERPTAAHYALAEVPATARLLTGLTRLAGGDAPATGSPPDVDRG